MAEGTHELRSDIEAAREDLARDLRELKGAARQSAATLKATAMRAGIALVAAVVVWKLGKLVIRRRRANRG